MAEKTVAKKAAAKKAPAPKTTVETTVTTESANTTEPDVDAMEALRELGAAIEAVVQAEAKPVRRGKRTVTLMEVVDQLPEDTGSQTGTRLATLFGELRTATENGEVEFDGDYPKWTAVQQYGSPNGAKTAIREIRGAGKGGTGELKPYAQGFELAERKVEVNGERVSILYARYTAA